MSWLFLLLALVGGFVLGALAARQNVRVDRCSRCSGMAVLDGLTYRCERCMQVYWREDF